MLARALGLVLLALVLTACAPVKTVGGSVADIEIPHGAAITSASLGEDGRMWYGYLTEEAGPGIGSLDASGAQKVFDLSSLAYGYSVNDIAAEPNGSIWLAVACYPEAVKCARAGYARFVPGAGRLERHIVGTGAGYPDGIVLSGDLVWLSDQRADAIVAVARNGRQTSWRIPDPNFKPFGLLVAGHEVYVTGQEPGKICILDERGAVRWVNVPDKTATLTNMALAPDGAVWVAEYDADKILSISAGGAVHAYAVPTADARPDAIAVDSDGVVWFTELDSDRLGRIGSDGVVHDALLPYGLTNPIFVFAAPGHMLYVMGSQQRWLGLYHAFVAGRIPEPAAMQ